MVTIAVGIAIPQERETIISKLIKFDEISTIIGYNSWTCVTTGRMRTEINYKDSYVYNSQQFWAMKIFWEDVILIRVAVSRICPMADFNATESCIKSEKS